MQATRLAGSGRRVMHKLVGPGNEVFPIRAVGVSTVMLAPGKLAIKQTYIDGRHLFGSIVVRSPQILCAQEPEHGPGSDGSHVAALLVQPFRVALLGNAV